MALRLKSHRIYHRAPACFLHSDEGDLACLLFRRAAISLRNVPGGIRTPNLLIRSQLLYPVELQTHLPGDAQIRGARPAVQACLE